MLSPDTNIYSFFETLCEKYVELYLFDNQYTFAKARQEVLRRANYLQSQKIKAGDIVALLAGNSAQWCLTYLSIIACGGTVLPLDTNLQAENYIHMLKAAGAKLLIVDKEHQFEGTLKMVDLLMEEAIDSDVKPLKKSEIGLHDVASLLFTSGTTGIPKIVTLTHQNILETSIAAADHMQIKPNDILLGVLPLYHVYGFVGNFTGPMSIGCRVVFQPSLKGPDIIKTLADYPVNVFPGVPQLWNLFMDAIINKAKTQSKIKYHILSYMIKNASLFRSLGLSFIPNVVFAPIHKTFGKSMKYLLSGGAPLSQKCFQFYTSLGYIMVNGYGLTETTGPICASALNNRKPSSAGRPLRGNQVEIRNKKPDGVGEIWLKGLAVSPGYYKNDAANQAAYDHDGWFNSGDLGYLDPDQELFITGRAKNIVVLASGKNVYPEELADYFQKSEHIQELVVFGQKTNNTEIVFAVIVPVVKDENSYNRIKQEVNRLNQGLPSYQCIHKFAVSHDELPKTSTKKIIVDEVIRHLQNGKYQTKNAIEARKPLAAMNPFAKNILDELKIFLRTNIIYEDDTFLDYAVDSMKQVEMIVTLEKNCQIKIDQMAFISAKNLRELLQYLETCQPGEAESIFQGKLETMIHDYYNPFLDVLLLIIKIYAKIFWKLRVIHPERLKLNNTILAANHSSLLDIVWILCSLPRQERKKIYLIGKKELAFLKIFFPQTVFVERQGNFLPSLKACADILRLGKSLIIFPEGTRSKDGKIGEFKTGAAYLAKHLNIAVIPVTINGAYQILPKHKRLFRLFGKGSLTIGTPILPDKFETAEALNQDIEKQITKNYFPPQIGFR